MPDIDRLEVLRDSGPPPFAARMPSEALTDEGANVPDWASSSIGCLSKRT